MDVDADGSYLEPSPACIRMPVPCNNRHRPTAVAFQIERVADVRGAVIRPSMIRRTHGTVARVTVDDVSDLA